MYENRGKQKNNVLETSLDMIVFLVCVCFFGLFGFFVCVLIYDVVIIFGSYLKQTVYKQTCVYKHVGLMSG